MMNEPTAISVLRAMNFRVEVWVSPFISLLTHQEIPDSTCEWLVETQDLTFFVFFDVHFHRINRSAGNDAVLRPIFMTVAFFVLFPVFGFAMVATNAGPGRVFSAARPGTYRMSRDEGVTFRIGISVFNLVRFDDLQGSLTIEAVLLILSKFDPLARGQISVFRNHPGNTCPCVISVLSHCRNEVAVGIRVGTAGGAAEQRNR